MIVIRCGGTRIAAAISVAIAGARPVKWSINRPCTRHHSRYSARTGAGMSARPRSLEIFSTIGGQRRPSNSFIATATTA